MIGDLAAGFAGLNDPREARKCDHQLIDILVIAVCAVIAGAERWEDIELYRRSKRAWLATFLDPSAGGGAGVSPPAPPPCLALPGHFLR
jgi:DDE_Tnp_1-associated